MNREQIYSKSKKVVVVRVDCYYAAQKYREKDMYRQ